MNLGKNRIFAILSISCFLFVQAIFAKDIVVVKVSDGDTVLTSEGEWIRLLGIDTPEMGYRNLQGKYVEDPAPQAREAKTYLESLVANKECFLEYDQELKDHFGRTLAYLYRKQDGLAINKDILSRGLAVSSFYPPNIKHSDGFMLVQAEAREKTKGLWSLKAVDASDASDYIGQIRTVRGIVKSVYLGKRFCYLNFGDDYRTDFTIEIAKKNLKYFRDLPERPEKWYTGKKVEVSARLKERNGPLIQVALPKQIRIIEE